MWRLKGLLGSTRLFIKFRAGFALLILSNRDMDIIKEKRKLLKLKWGDFFILKTVYKENEDMRTKTTHILHIILDENIIENKENYVYGIFTIYIYYYTQI